MTILQAVQAFVAVQHSAVVGFLGGLGKIGSAIGGAVGGASEGELYKRLCAVSTELAKTGKTFEDWFEEEGKQLTPDQQKTLWENLESVFKREAAVVAALAPPPELRFVKYYNAGQKAEPQYGIEPVSLMEQFAPTLIAHVIPSQISSADFDTRRHAIAMIGGISRYGTEADKDRLMLWIPNIADHLADPRGTQVERILELQTLSDLVPPADIAAGKSGLTPERNASVIIAFLETGKYTFGEDAPDKLNISKVDFSSSYTAALAGFKPRLLAVLPKVVERYVLDMRAASESWCNQAVLRWPVQHSQSFVQVPMYPTTPPIDLAVKWIVAGSPPPHDEISKRLFDELQKNINGEINTSRTLAAQLAYFIATLVDSDDAKKVALFLATAISKNENLRAPCHAGYMEGLKSSGKSTLNVDPLFTIYGLALQAAPVGASKEDVEVRKNLSEGRIKAYLDAVFAGRMNVDFALKVIKNGVGAKEESELADAKKLLELGKNQNSFIQKLAIKFTTMDPKDEETSKLAWFLITAIDNNSDLLDVCVIPFGIVAAVTGASSITQAEEGFNKLRVSKGQAPLSPQADASRKEDGRRLVKSLLYRTVLSQLLSQPLLSSLSTYFSEQPNAGAEAILTHFWSSALGGSADWKLSSEEMRGDALIILATMLTEYLQKPKGLFEAPDPTLKTLAGKLIEFGKTNAASLSLEVHYSLTLLDMALCPSPAVLKGAANYLSFVDDGKKQGIITYLIGADANRAFQVIEPSIIVGFIGKAPQVLQELPKQERGSTLLYCFSQSDFDDYMPVICPKVLASQKDREKSTEINKAFETMFTLPEYDGTKFELAIAWLRYAALYNKANVPTLAFQGANQTKINEAAKRVCWNSCSIYTLIFYPWKYWVSFRLGNWISNFLSKIPLIGRALAWIGIINTMDTLKSKFLPRDNNEGILSKMVKFFFTVPFNISSDERLAREEIRQHALKATQEVQEAQRQQQLAAVKKGRLKKNLGSAAVISQAFMKEKQERPSPPPMKTVPSPAPPPAKAVLQTAPTEGKRAAASVPSQTAPSAASSAASSPVPSSSSSSSSLSPSPSPTSSQGGEVRQGGTK